jgi:rubrerythrin
MGRKNHNKDKDEAELARVKRENQQLRKHIRQLQKQLSRVDLEAYSNLKELVDAQNRQSKKLKEESDKEGILKKWLCHECKNDYIRLVVVTRPDGIYYFRRCPNCSKKTRLQKYDDKVEGIRDEDIPKTKGKN